MTRQLESRSSYALHSSAPAAIRMAILLFSSLAQMDSYLYWKAVGAVEGDVLHRSPVADNRVMAPYSPKREEVGIRALLPLAGSGLFLRIFADSISFPRF